MCHCVYCDGQCHGGGGGLCVCGGGGGGYFLLSHMLCFNSLAQVQYCVT